MIGGGRGGGGGVGNRAEADRWLVTSEKLLASGDLQGAKTFAIRACEADPSRAEAADYILAISDTLIAGESRVGNANLPDWYAVLRLVRLTHNPELVATQYRRLALLLNPRVNRLPFADQAFRLVSDAWYALSDPSRKTLYDRDLQSSQLGQLGQPSFQPYNQGQQNKQQQQPHQSLQSQQQLQQRQQQFPPTQQFQWQQPSKNPSAEQERPNLNNATHSTRKTRLSGHRQQCKPDNRSQSAPSVAQPAQPVTTEPPRPGQAETPTEPRFLSFWTACPYCFVLFEYPKAYEECALRCQNCRRGFQAVTIQTPPVEGKGEDVYFCSWSIFPLGFSGHTKTAGWSPVSPLFACPTQKVAEQATMTISKPTMTMSKPAMTMTKEPAAPRIYYDEDDVYVEISEEDYEEEDDGDEDWQNNVKGNKKAKLGKGKESTAKSTKKQRAEKAGRGSQNVDSIDGASNPAASIAQDAAVVASSSSGAAKAPVNTGRKRVGTGAKNLGRLDLNVEFSNEVEEPAVARGKDEGTEPGNREVDNIEGIGFFEGLDEFLSSLPILSVVADDKVKAT